MADDNIFSGLLDTLARPDERRPEAMPVRGAYSGQFSGLLNAIGNPSWSDQSIPAEQRSESLLQSHANARVPWSEAEKRHRDLFPGVDTSSMQKPYEQQQQLELQRENFKAGDEKWSSLIHRTAIPFASDMQNRMLDQNYSAARDRYNKAEASEQDLKDIAAWERLREIDKDRSPIGKVGVGLLSIPAIAGETWAAGKVLGPLGRGLGVQAGGLEAGIGKAAISTPLIPSLYGEKARQNAMENGGGEFNLKNLAPAVAMGALENAAFALTGGAGEGIKGSGLKPFAQRVGAGAAAGIAGQQIGDVIAGATKLETGYGAFGELVNGDAGAALKRLAVQAATFAAFSAIHGGDPDKAMRKTAESIKDLKSKGYGPELAASEVGKAVEIAKKAAVDNHGSTEETQKAVANSSNPGPAQDLAKDLVQEIKQSEASPEFLKKMADGMEPADAEAFLKAHAGETQGGPPQPEPGTGIINPVQSGVPGIVSGAVEIQPGEKVKQAPPRRKVIQPLPFDPEKAWHEERAPALSLEDLQRLRSQNSQLRRLGLPENTAAPGSPTGDPETQSDVASPGAINEKIWYHGSPTKDIPSDEVSSSFTNHESLFGSGVYLTDNEGVSKGYARKHGKDGQVYPVRLNVSRVLDLETGAPPDVRKLFSNNAIADGERLSKALKDENATSESLFQALRKDVIEESHANGVPTSEYAELFQTIESGLRELGYDAITHTGGLRVGKVKHRALILLDPRGEMDPKGPPYMPNPIRSWDGKGIAQPAQPQAAQPSPQGEIGDYKQTGEPGRVLIRDGGHVFDVAFALDNNGKHVLPAKVIRVFRDPDNSGHEPVATSDLDPKNMVALGGDQVASTIKAYGPEDIPSPGKKVVTDKQLGHGAEGAGSKPGNAGRGGLASPENIAAVAIAKHLGRSGGVEGGAALPASGVIHGDIVVAPERSQEPHPVSQAFVDTFPGTVVTANGDLKATIGEGAAARNIYLQDGSDNNSVRLDFGWTSPERAGKGETLQPGSMDTLRAIDRFVAKMAQTGETLEYVAVGGRERLYKKIMERNGFEQIAGPTGEGQGLRRWRHKEAMLEPPIQPEVNRGEQTQAEAPAQTEQGGAPAALEAQPPARPQGEAEPLSRSEAAHADLEALYEESGLTDREKHVVRERLIARSHKEIGKDKQVLKIGGKALTRARIKQLEKSAMYKLGANVSIAQAIHAEQRADTMVDALSRGQPVTAVDLGKDAEAVVGKAKTKLSEAERKEREINKITEQWLKEAQRERPDPERLRTLYEQATRIHEGNVGASPEGSVEPEEVPGERGSRPASVRPEALGGVPEGPAPSEAGPAGEGVPERTQGDVQGTPAASGGREAGDNQLSAAERRYRGRKIPKAMEAEAGEEGIAPDDLHGLARTIRAEDAAGVQAQNEILKDIRSQLPGKGKLMGAENYQQGADVPGLEEAAQHFRDRGRPELGSEDKLFELLRKGNRQPLSEQEVYDRALSTLRDSGPKYPEGKEPWDLEAGRQSTSPNAPDSGSDVFDEAYAAFKADQDKGLLGGQAGTLGVNTAALSAKGKEIVAYINQARTYAGQAARRLAGQHFPRSTDLDRSVGEAMSDHIGSPVHAEVASEYYGRLVAGEDATPEFRKQVGGVIMENRFRTAKQNRLDQAQKDVAEFKAARQRMKNETDPAMIAMAERYATAAAKRAHEQARLANAVTTFVGAQDSPFKTEAEYQAVLADPQVKAAVERYRDKYVPEKQKNFMASQGLDTADEINSITQDPKLPVLALALTADEPATNSTVYAGGGEGSLLNLKLRRDPSAIEAKLSEGAYELDIQKIIEKDLMRSIPIANQAKMYRAAEAAGLGKWAPLGERAEGYTPMPGTQPPKNTQNAKYGDVFHVKDEIAAEFTSALKLDRLEDYKLVLNNLMQVPTQASLASAVEMLTHGVNLTSALLTKPSGAWHGGLGDLLSNIYDRFANKPAFREKMLKLAEINALKPKGPETGTFSNLLGKVIKWANPEAELSEKAKYFDPTYWSGRVLDDMGSVVRATLYDWAERQVKAGSAVDTATNRRDFINQSVGNYFKAAQNGLVKWLRDTGIGPFATAATTFTTEGVKSLGLNTNLEATSHKAQAAMKAEVLLKMASVIGGTMIYNMAKWGRYDGDDQTPAMALKIADGKSFDLSPLVHVKRGLRAVGLLGYFEGKRQGKDTGASVDKGIEGILHSITHPAMGPGPTFAWTAATGKDTFGHQLAPKVSAAETASGQAKAAAKGIPEHGSSQFWENLKTALANANPVYAALTGAAERGKEVPAEQKAAKIAGPLGFKYREEPKKRRIGSRP